MGPGAPRCAHCGPSNHPQHPQTKPAPPAQSQQRAYLQSKRRRERLRRSEEDHQERNQADMPSRRHAAEGRRLMTTQPGIHASPTPLQFFDCAHRTLAQSPEVRRSGSRLYSLPQIQRSRSKTGACSVGMADRKRLVACAKCSSTDNPKDSSGGSAALWFRAPACCPSAR